MTGVADHALKLEFGDGQFNATVICPETGCTPSYACGQCGREIDDAETKRCYDCPTEPAACWLKSWEAEGVIDECVTGVVTVPITSEWNGEYPVVKFAEAEPVDLDALLREVRCAVGAFWVEVSLADDVCIGWYDAPEAAPAPRKGSRRRPMAPQPEERDVGPCDSLESALRAVLAEVEEMNGSS